MTSIHDILRARIHAQAGLCEPSQHPYTLAELAETEWSPRFERLMRNRLIMGALRYGRLHSPGKPSYDRYAGARKRWAQYILTGNLECLVDAANLALLEFEEGTQENRHWIVKQGDHCCV